MKWITKAQGYIDGVHSGEILSCEYVRLAVARHVNDLERSQDPDYPYYFCEETAELAIKFVSICRHTDGSWYGKKFNLKPFQCFLISQIYGWLRKSDDKRRYRKAYIEMPRKNGKSELMGALALKGLLKENEYGAQVYTFANSKDQARVVWDICQNMSEQMVDESPKAKKLINFSYYNISVKKTNSKLEPLAADSKLLDGRRPYIAIGDEIHEAKDFKLLKVLETGMGNREDPLLLLITTAGFNLYGPCYQFRKIGVDMLRGLQEIDELFCCIWSIDEGDDWEDPKTWRKANPNLGDSPKMDYMEAAYKMAKAEGAHAVVEFKTKNLNMWVSSAVEFIPDAAWRASDEKFTLTQFEGQPCWAGLDMSRSIDITALCMLFPVVEDGREVYKCIFKFWCPQDTIEKRTRTDQVPYLDWAEKGFITPIPGSVIDDAFVEAEIMALNDKYKINILEYDPRFAHGLIKNLEQNGLNVSKFTQNSTNYTGPIKDLEKGIIEKKFHFNHNPVIRWMNSNVLLKTFAGGGLMIDKDKSVDRIDGMSALLMAFGGFQTDAEDYRAHVYERRGVRFI